MKVRQLTIIVLLLAMLLPAGPTRAQALQADSAGHDSIRISLLTCAAGQEIYSLFGHTAIRYENYTRDIDRVYNYGIFDFDTPNFVLRFALGETDYQLGVSSYQRFAAGYAATGNCTLSPQPSFSRSGVAVSRAAIPALTSALLQSAACERDLKTAMQ